MGEKRTVPILPKWVKKEPSLFYPRRNKMSAKLMYGKDTAAAVKAELDPEIEELKARGIMPRLDIIRVGKRPEDQAYENGAKKRFEKLGIALEVTELPENVTEEDFEETLQGMNNDPEVHGILIFRPLPETLDVEKISRLTAPEKDVDCFDPVNIARVLTGDEEGFAPCTAEAAIEIGERSGIDCLHVVLLHTDALLIFTTVFAGHASLDVFMSNIDGEDLMSGLHRAA